MYKKKAVLVPPCMLAGGFQVISKKGNNDWKWQCMQLFFRYGIDIIPFRCVESLFEGYQNGLRRSAHGIDFYQKLEGYREHCDSIAQTTVDEIGGMQRGGYTFAAIIGIEHSPSCAVNYMYTHHGMQRRSGIFVQSLKERLSKEGICIPCIGINRRYPQKALKEIEEIICENVKEEG